jgi:WD40 repeat protein/serine/threonine protein kinase/two-component SAPR family response regulator
MSQIEISLLGPFAVKVNGEPLTAFRMLKVKALLIYLMAESHQAHRREQLMTLLWPGMPESSARANLRQVLFHLRQAIPDFDVDGTAVPFFIANRYTIHLNPAAPVTIDVVQFDAWLDQVKTHNHVDILTCTTCYKWLETAVSLYRDHFLSDFYLDDSNEFEAWAEITRQQYRRKVLDALDTLTAIAIRRATYPDARRTAERQIAIDNLHESAYRQLMEILALSGQRAEALVCYESLRRLLTEELGMDPADRTTELYEKIQAGDLRFDRLPLPGVRGYELKEEIGAGTFGVIHRAVQTAVSREVAIKIIHPRYANQPEFIRRFETEAQIIARLEHPHIVPLYDFWREPDGAYLVMRLLGGGNLLTNLQSGIWSPERTRHFLDQIALALFAAHQRGIIHRDIKPANILFDHDGNAYLSDFGIAKNLHEAHPLTADGDIIGTLDYISPEQIQAGEITPQSDIYSLGAVLYEMLSGEKPFAGLHPAALIRSHLSEPLPLVSKSQPNFPPRMDSVIQQATAKQPQDRFPSVMALAEAFAAALNDHAAISTYTVTPQPDIDLMNPYKGLRAYQEADADDFFGREALTAQLVNRLADGRFLAVVGPSGSGKSSVVKAGLIPALRQGALPDSENWYVARMTPGTHPLEELELALWPIAVNPPPSLVEPMQKDSRGLLRTVRRILPDAVSSQLLLVIDQFEELFTLTNETRRTHFLGSLYTALTAARSPLRLVITLRADYYDRPLQYQPLADLFKQHTELVLGLNRDELLWAIQEPARRVGVSFEDGLLADIVADVAAQPGALPLLQYALTELFNARNGRTLTRTAYAAIGGVPGALARRAEDIFAGLDENGRSATRRLFLHLVTLGNGQTATRRRVTLTEIAQLGVDGDIINEFGRARLLTFDHDPLTRESTVEVAHEALLSRWERLQQWIDASRDDIRWQRQLAALATEWDDNQRDNSFLLHGTRLLQFAAWQQQDTLPLLPIETAFLQASLAARAEHEATEAARQQRELQAVQQLAAAEAQRAKEQKQAAAGLRRRAALLAGALALVAILAAVGLFLAQQARQNAAAAERSAAEAQSIALATGAQSALANHNPDLALGLALAANDLDTPPALARRTLYDVALAPGLEQLIVGGGGWRWSMDVTADRRFIASGADDGSVTIWEAATGAELMRLDGEHTEPIGDIAFTPDGRFLLSTAYDDQIIKWDAISGEVVWRAVNPAGDPNTISISPDGHLAAFGTEGGVVTLWDVASGEMVGEFAGHDPDWQVLPVAFSPDGHLLVSGSETGEAIIWDVATQTVQQRIPVLDNVLFALAFSPDGQVLAAGGMSNAIQFFNVATGALTGSVTGLPDWVFDMTFSDDGSLLLVASRDGAVMAWDMFAQQWRRTFYGEAGRALNVAIVDETTIAASYTTGNIRLWDVADGRIQQTISLDAFVNSFVQSDDGRFGAAGLTDAITLFDLQTGEVVHEIAMTPGDPTVLNGGDVSALAYSPDGTQLLSGSADGRLLLWDVATGEQVRSFAGHTAFIHQIVFSLDGRFFLSSADDRQLILWDVAGGEPRFVYTHPTDVITAVAFSPDGHLFAGGVGATRYVADFDPEAVRDTRILLWETETGNEVGQFAGHEGPVTTVAFSPDNRLLLSGGLDAVLRLWDVAGGEQMHRFDGHSSGIMAVVFSGDGTYAASGAQDGTVIVWDVVTGDLLRQIQAHASVLHHLAFTADSSGLWSAAEDGAVHLWRTALNDAFIPEWLAAHRRPQPLTCLQQIQAGLVPTCAERE